MCTHEHLSIYTIQVYKCRYMYMSTQGHAKILTYVCRVPLSILNSKCFKQQLRIIKSAIHKLGFKFPLQWFDSRKGCEHGALMALKITWWYQGIGLKPLITVTLTTYSWIFSLYCIRCNSKYFIRTTWGKWHNFSHFTMGSYKAT